MKRFIAINKTPNTENNIDDNNLQLQSPIEPVIFENLEKISSEKQLYSIPPDALFVSNVEKSYMYKELVDPLNKRSKNFLSDKIIDIAKYQIYNSIVQEAYLSTMNMLVSTFNCFPYNNYYNDINFNYYFHKLFFATNDETFIPNIHILISNYINELNKVDCLNDNIGKTLSKNFGDLISNYIFSQICFTINEAICNYVYNKDINEIRTIINSLRCEFKNENPYFALINYFKNILSNNLVTLWEVLSKSCTNLLETLNIISLTPYIDDNIKSQL